MNIMAFSDDISNPGLGLGLGLGFSLDLQDEQYCRLKKKEDDRPCNTKAYPSLTLGPPDDDDVDDDDDDQVPTKTDSDECVHPLQACNSPSAVSSFSNSSSIKRERDHELELEDDKIPSSSLLDLDQNANARKKLRLTKQQSAVLEDSFKHHSTLNPKQKQELARKLNLRARQVEVWFQNRRARTKLKQTEVECEVLKKCCEALTEENKRLQKELQELKSVMKRGAVYVQLPVASHTLCPSCEKISSGSSNNRNGPSPNTPLLIASNKLQYNPQCFYKTNWDPFTQSSAAC